MAMLNEAVILDQPVLNEDPNRTPSVNEDTTTANKETTSSQSSKKYGKTHVENQSENDEAKQSGLSPNDDENTPTDENTVEVSRAEENIANEEQHAATSPSNQDGLLMLNEETAESQDQRAATSPSNQEAAEAGSKINQAPSEEGPDADENAAIQHYQSATMIEIFTFTTSNSNVITQAASVGEEINNTTEMMNEETA